MPRKLTLDLALDLILYGIVAHCKDYKLAWELNRLLAIDLTKTDDLQDANKEVGFHSHYHFEDEENYYQVKLIGNKSYSGLFLPEQQIANYFLVFQGNTEIIDLANTEEQMLASKLILKHYPIEHSQLKNKHLLYFD